MRPAVRHFATLAAAVASVAVVAGAASEAGAAVTDAGPSAVAVVRCDLATPTVEVTYSNPAGEQIEFATTVDGPEPVDPAVAGGPMPLLVAPGASTVMDYPLLGGPAAVTIAFAGRSTSSTFGPGDCASAAVGFDLAPPPVLLRTGRW
jgi:hypothetical protein